MRRLAAAGAMLALAACSSVEKFTATDVANAAVIATKAGDATAGACWTSLGGALMPSPNPSNDGLAVLVERQRLLQGVASGPCAAVILPIVMQLGALGLHVGTAAALGGL